MGSVSILRRLLVPLPHEIRGQTNREDDARRHGKPGDPPASEFPRRAHGPRADFHRQSPRLCTFRALRDVIDDRQSLLAVESAGCCLEQLLRGRTRRRVAHPLARSERARQFFEFALHVTHECSPISWRNSRSCASPRCTRLSARLVLQSSMRATSGTL